MGSNKRSSKIHGWIMFEKIIQQLLLMLYISKIKKNALLIFQKLIKIVKNK